MCKEKFKFRALERASCNKSTGASSTAWKNCLQSQFNISFSLYICKTYPCDLFHFDFLRSPSIFAVWGSMGQKASVHRLPLSWRQTVREEPPEWSLLLLFRSCCWHCTLRGQGCQGRPVSEWQSCEELWLYNKLAKQQVWTLFRVEKPASGFCHYFAMWPYNLSFLGVHLCIMGWQSGLG